MRLSLSTTVPAYTANLGTKEESNSSQREALGIRIQCDIHTDARSTCFADGSLQELDVTEVGSDASKKVLPCV